MALSLVPRPGRGGGVIPVYSHRVCRAITAVRTHQSVGDLDTEERRELAEALQILAIAALLELQIASVADG